MIQTFIAHAWGITKGVGPEKQASRWSFARNSPMKYGVLNLFRRRRWGDGLLVLRRTASKSQSGEENGYDHDRF